MAAKIRRDDEVIVISGKDRGKTGKVMRVDPRRTGSTSRASTSSSATAAARATAPALRSAA